MDEPATITLSFDNGPEHSVTPLVLDVLRARRIRATFFVLGHKLVRPGWRTLAERAHAEGHWIGNHTWSHATPLGELGHDPQHVPREIDATEALLDRLAHPDRLFRPFGRGGRLGPHLLSEAARDRLATLRSTIVLWTAVPGDYADPDGWPERALEQCATGRQALVLHDLPNGAMRHLDRVLGALADRGASFVQDFPDSVVPMRNGKARPGLEAFVTGAQGARDAAD
jgi:peptidoglycan-N-acetylglucosamine deacetylase